MSVIRLVVQIPVLSFSVKSGSFAALLTILILCSPRHAGGATGTDIKAADIVMTYGDIDVRADINFWIDAGIPGFELKSPTWWTDSLSREHPRWSRGDRLWVSGQVTMHKTSFNQGVDLSNSVFRDGVWIVGNGIFGAPSTFRNSLFLSAVRINRDLEGDLDSLDKPQFVAESDLDFSGSHFVNYLDVGTSRFGSRVNFEGVQVDDFADFAHCAFRSAADFSRTKFRGDTYFAKSKFFERASFSSAQFSQIAEFSDCQFGIFADFKRCQFLGVPNFTGAVMPETLDLSLIVLENNQLDLSQVRLPASGAKCKVKLLGTDISKIKLNMNVFEILMSDSLSSDQRSALYEGVLNKLDNDGFRESYRVLDTEYRQWKYRQEGSWLVNHLDRWWWDYGYDRGRIVIWTLSLWALLSIISWRWESRLNTEVYHFEFLEGTPESTSVAFRFLRRAVRTVAYVGIIFLGLNLNLERFKKGALLRHLGLFSYVFVVYGLGLICVGFIANWIFRN